MAKNRRGRAFRLDSTINPVLRPLLWSAVLGAAVAFAFTNPVQAAPVYADPPPPNSIPDTGSRPQLPDGIQSIQLPGGPAVPGGAPILPVGINGPLATQINNLQVEVNQLGENLLVLRQSKDAGNVELQAATEALTRAEQDLTVARQAADRYAEEALKEAAALPPGEFGTDLHGLGALSRLQKGEAAGGDTDAAARELARATEAQQHALQTKLDAESRLGKLTEEFTKLEATYNTKAAALVKLRQDNAAQVEAIERAQEAAEQRNGAQYLNGSYLNGKAAHPRALAAVSYALAQLGDPYLWGSEGPNRFDCSGLMWAAYRSKGADYFDLPRVSRDQYYATRFREVDRSALLPGDLLFFASNSSWTSIHHVAMYIGGGRMVHAPTTGDVVKISQVPWSRLYKATRIFGAVDAPKTNPPKPPTNTPKPPTNTPKPPTDDPTTPPDTDPPTTPPDTPPATPPKPPAPPRPPKPRPTATTPSPTPQPPSSEPSSEEPSASTSAESSPSAESSGS
ncbi:NlpC/P60 family protein [Micromonospora sp. NPDC049559]|uniref:NlpC/P60 family protein n=1 Tax=Micromonospora sp. NPDC049559 TaxID=3155923 RepID=UPI003418552E